MATLEQIQARIAKLQAQAEAVAAKQNSGVIEKIRVLMDKHGISIAEIDAHIGGRRGRKSASKSVGGTGVVAAKYVDPKTGATWSGRGRAPAWIAGAKDRTKFLVEGGQAVVVARTTSAAKPGNYPRGPQPAMYRDPKTGATWSGRGRAPAWLANAKDRAKFLIGDEAVSASSGSKSVKAAPAQKAGAKKAAAKKVVAKKVGAERAPATKKAAAKKPAAKKAVVKKAPARKVRAKKAVAEAVTPVAAAEQPSTSTQAAAE